MLQTSQKKIRYLQSWGQPVKLTETNGSELPNKQCFIPTNVVIDCANRKHELNINKHSADQRLSRIDTLWSVVREAHLSDRERAQSAQQRLLDLYSGAIRRYLVGALRNDDLADEIFQEFAYRFLKGDFKSADPERGKFRSFVKTILFRMVATHFRKSTARKESSGAMVEEIQSPAEEQADQDDELFLQSWRDDVLTRTWNALETYETTGGAPYNTVLRIRVGNPAANTPQMAELISTALNREISEGNVRVQVHRAREKFASLLIETIADSLPVANRESIESELIELRLIDYCRDSLDSLNQ